MTSRSGCSAGRTGSASRPSSMPSPTPCTDGTAVARSMRPNSSATGRTDSRSSSTSSSTGPNTASAERVHAATTRYASRADDLWARRKDLQPVTDEQLANAEKSVEDAETARATAQDLLKKAIERVGQTEQWEKLEKRRKELERQIVEA